jgi:hypothetical protein
MIKSNGWILCDFTAGILSFSLRKWDNVKWISALVRKSHLSLDVLRIRMAKMWFLTMTTLEYVRQEVLKLIGNSGEWLA